MQTFLTRHCDEVKGVLSGFDRVRFRGTLRWLSTVAGLESFLVRSGVLLKEFKPWAQGLTDQIRQSTADLAKALGRPIRYLYSSALSKEDIALNIAEVDGIREGLVCVLTAVEPCRTFFLRRNRERRRLELSSLPGKCLHQYFYVRHPQWGLIYLRLQTWLPFTVYVGINGREWLARQLVQQGIGFEQRDNCFVDLADVPRAQAVLAAQLQTNWADVLNGLLRQFHPAHARLFGSTPLDHYWSAEETEWATDVLFRSPEALARLYPRLARHAITTFGSNDVLRFLGRSSSLAVSRQRDPQHSQDPARGGPRQARTQWQLRQDVRQAAHRAASGDNHQPTPRHACLSAEGGESSGTEIVATVAQGGRRFVSPSPSEPKVQ